MYLSLFRDNLQEECLKIIKIEQRNQIRMNK